MYFIRKQNIAAEKKIHEHGKCRLKSETATRILNELTCVFVSRSERSLSIINLVNSCLPGCDDLEKYDFRIRK